ncbi:MAG TPA: hypothetical protein PKA53_04485 [Sphingobacterium sp.]|nr:hypothetical protein [Sphingobacterium sp.]
MKKLSLKSKLLLSAILMGGMVAGAHTISNLPNPLEETYDWTGEPNAPLHPNGTLDDKTPTEAEEHYGCAGEEEVCAIGVPTSGTGPNAFIRLE